jgi:hypothetical protein
MFPPAYQRAAGGERTYQLLNLVAPLVLGADGATRHPPPFKHGWKSAEFFHYSLLAACAMLGPFGDITEELL